MLDKTSPIPNYQGFNLIELIISMSLGVVLVAGILSIFSGSVRSNTESVLSAKMTQELNAVMEIITSDIRRAGYWSTAGTLGAAGNANPYGIEMVRPDDGTGNACILYSYDPSAAGIGFSERGFRHSGNTIEWLGNGNNNNFCDVVDVSWQPITESSMVQITDLDFADASTCWNVTQGRSCDPCVNDDWALNDILTYTRIIDITVAARMATVDVNAAAQNQRTMQMNEKVQVRNAETGQVTVVGPNNGVTYCRKKLPLNSIL